MEAKLEKLIEKIKKEGVGSAQKEADKIIKDAKNKAKNELESAQKEIETQKKNAKKEIESFESNANDSIKQAARDTIISVRDEIKKLFNNVLNKKIVDSLDEDLMKKIIIDIAKNWAEGKDLDVIANGVDIDKLQKLVSKQVKNDLKNSIEIKLDKKISHGFRIGIKGEDMHYDFTDESILDTLKLYLNPKLNELLSKK
ncbi:MAG: hypothetical protein U9R41_00055 [Candidatus Marinimicrobia bacterium]|nr:hypothetical protein [Candidatus Neomarinimicrobiota bacterium]